ncbi:3-dehydroquinate synthase [bacterium]|nr:3-dehydroquinate synthase [bacterium]
MDLLPPARAVFITGFMGTGKTTNGSRLAGSLRLPFVDTDDVVEDLAGRKIKDIFAEDGEECFRELETEALRKVLRGPRSVVATGGGAMTRPENVSLMKAAGPVICLEARAETIQHRTGRRCERPLLLTSSPLDTIRELLAARAEAYAQADFRVSTDHGERETILREMRSALGSDARGCLLVQPFTRVPVCAGNGEYGVHLAPDALRSLGRLCPPLVAGTRCAVVTNETVGRLFGERVLESLHAVGWEPRLATIPDGEAHKTLKTVSMLYDALVDAGVDAGGAVFALGGGVVGDVAGFVAATYRRGIRFAQLPTTLLAQVDASVGGKVAVDHPKGKNLIGAFYQPSAVVVDTGTLVTLPERELRCGLAEVIKHAIIADVALFEYLEENLHEFVALDCLAVRYVVARNCQIKAHFVEQDPFDRGVRAALNYGHTIGHALERAAGDWQLHHGEAVAVGIAAEARVALELGLCDAETVHRQIALLEQAGLPTYVPGIDADAAWTALQQDKKIAAGALRLPLVPRIGAVEVRERVAPETLLGALTMACGEPHGS